MKKLISTFLVLFIVFSTVFGIGLYVIYKPEVDTAVEEVEEQETEEETFENLDTSNYKERVNVLLLGVDTLETDKDQRGTRSDTIMILSVDPVTNTGFILSIPRDSYVKIHGTNEYTKINHAHSYGGTDLAINTIKDFINIPIHHYMKVDYRALFKTVDDLGGVEFDVPIDMKYRDSASNPPLNIDLKAGLQTLNSEQAMGLLRFRQGYPDKDLGRIRTQQAFIEAVLKKIASPASITKIPKYIETIYQYVETDMTIQNVMSLVKIGISIDFSTLQKATIPGVPAMRNGASIIEVDTEKTQELLTYLLSGNYVSEETEAESGEKSDASAQTTAQDDSTDINEYTIIVLNGSGVSGIGRRVSDILKIREINVDKVGNADSYDHETTVIYYKSDKAAAEKIKEILKVGTIKQGAQGITSTDAEIIIVIGKDFS